MADFLTGLCILGAAVSFAAWAALVNRRSIARFSEFVSRIPRSHLAVFVLFTTVATLSAQKPEGTNAPPNGASPPQMMMVLPPQSFPPPNLPVVGGAASVTSNDVARGYRLESVATNDAYSYAMPTNGTRYGRWWKRGAYEDVFRLDLDGMRFPCGTNLCSSLWVYTWGMVGAHLADASNRIAATGVPMSAVPFASQFWSAALLGGVRRLTWHDFALNRDTNTPVSAQLDLYPSGDFVARSNLVESVYRRVNPDDWDDDGYPNNADPNPYAYDGDNFGPCQELPEGANSNAYCWVDIVVSNANALVTFAGDGPSSLPDPRFVARAGETNRVTILIGKTYTVTCNMPVSCVDKSSADIDVLQNSPTELYVCWPVTIEVTGMRSGASFSMAVWPDCLGGAFTWTNSCCSISSSGGVFTYSCNDACHCTGCAAMGYYGYEGYRLPAYGGSCGCSSDGEYDVPPDEEDDEGPYDAGAAAAFSKSAVIFEDGYWNTPTNWVARQSTQTELHCVAHGGPNGGHVRFEILGEDKLERVSGHVLPVEQDISPGKKLDFTITYTGKLPSSNANDIVVTTTFTENVQGATPEVSTATLTSVKVELVAKTTAPQNADNHRHTYGVAEEISYYSFPASIDVAWAFPSDFISREDGIIMCPWSIQTGTEATYIATVTAADEIYRTSTRVLEPVIAVTNVRVNVYSADVLPVFGESGHLLLYQDLYAIPLYVSFKDVQFCEVPDESQSCSHDGYYDDRIKGGNWSHTASDGAGTWYTTLSSGYVMSDKAGRRTSYSTPWIAGTKEWAIPMAWGAGGVIEIPFVPNPTTQKFFLQANGTFKIRKFGHEAERNVYGLIWKDGELQW